MRIGDPAEGAEEAPPTEAEIAAKAERRRRGLQVSTFCLHSMAWVLLTFYATDYLPPLAIRLTVGLSSARETQYLVGYATLGTICLLLGLGFGAFYRSHIAASRYSWRWFFFPGLVALVLIPAQGENELLSRAVEAVFLLSGIAWGRALAGPFRRSRRSLPAGRGADN